MYLLIQKIKKMRIEGSPPEKPKPQLRGLEKFPPYQGNLRGLEKFAKPAEPTEEEAKDVGEVALDEAIRVSKDILGGHEDDEALIQKNLDYLIKLGPMAGEAGSYQVLLSGESRFSTLSAGQGEISAKKILSELGLGEGGMAAMFGAAVKGADYEKLKAEKPQERYKFYSSFDLTSPDKVKLGEQWFAEIAKRAYEEGISLTTKTFDHSYDSLNLYTWDPAKVAEIVKELYPKYLELGLYSSTPHFLQGEIEGVNPDHVGFVQEPVASESAGSHSTRMGRLGSSIDEAFRSGEVLDLDTYRKAAVAAGVDPANPFLLAA